MKTDLNIENEVQKTLDALENIKRVDGNPFLFTRIKAQLEKDRQINAKKTLQFSNVLSWSMMVLLLTINIIAITDNLKTETSQDSLIESIASDFGFQDQETDYLNQN